MLTKWNNKKKYYKSQWYYAIFVLIFCLHCNISSFFPHDYCMIILYFDLLLLLFFTISPSFSPKYIYVKLFTCFFSLLLRCQIEFKCLHTSVYIYIVHVLLLINIDCTWLNIESVLFIRLRDYQLVYSFIYTSPVQRFNAHLECIFF